MYKEKELTLTRQMREALKDFDGPMFLYGLNDMI